ncbi:MAG: hypothetical protein M1834_005838 [Cirrosporium novae-zelandiae]|nr:MAG: hypothetical protein M1834_005838 [Cirrosporium novae-zelandiae]
MSPKWTHLIRFIAEEDGLIHLGEIDPTVYPDVGLAMLEGQKVTAKEIKGTAFDGVFTDKILQVKQLLCPLSYDEVPIIRCLGLNYHDHAKEAKMPIPDVPVLFVKPRHALNGPHPSKIVVPKIAQDGSSDYEAELTFVISKTGKDIREDEAMEYVLGYTCGNDVSCRVQQFKNSQWSYSKGFDASAPIGPMLVSPAALPNVHELGIKAIHNGTTVQDSNTS